MNIYSKNNPPPLAYVYAYVRSDTTPYYIGKGTNTRAWEFHTKFVKVPDDERIIILISGLTEAEAYRHEKELIKRHGRKNLDESGILINRTPGGIGGPGAPKGRPAPNRGMPAWNRGIPMSEDAKRKASKKLKGQIPWNKGIPKTPEDRNKTGGHLA